MASEARIVAQAAELLPTQNTRTIPFYETQVSAGFPSPAQNDRETQIDLHEHMVNDKDCTFVAVVTGFSMINAGISHGSWVVVDRSIEAKSGDIVLAVVNDEFLVKFYQKNGKQTWLMPANKDFKPLKIDESHGFYVWGVVTFVITNARTIFNLCTFSSTATTSTSVANESSAQVWKVGR